MIYLILFTSFFKIGLFSFGGGYAMLPMISQEVVDKYGWVSNKEFIDVVAISQSTPGPIAATAATYIGYKVAEIKLLGAAIALIGMCLPSVIIMLILCKFFFTFKNNEYMDSAIWGLRPAVVGLIAAAAIMVSQGAFVDYKSILIFVVVFVLAYRFKVDAVLLTILSGGVGVIIY